MHYTFCSHSQSVLLWQHSFLFYYAKKLSFCLKKIVCLLQEHYPLLYVAIPIKISSYFHSSKSPTSIYFIGNKLTIVGGVKGQEGYIS